MDAPSNMNLVLMEILLNFQEKSLVEKTSTQEKTSDAKADPVAADGW